MLSREWTRCGFSGSGRSVSGAVIDDINTDATGGRVDAVRDKVVGDPCAVETLVVIAVDGCGVRGVVVVVEPGADGIDEALVGESVVVDVAADRVCGV